MKTFFIIGLLLLTPKIWASLGTCPTHAATNKNDRRMIEFLQEMQGRYQLGSCQVEIQTCQISNTTEIKHGNIIADMLVIDSDGFERYIPFYVPEYEYSGTRQIEMQNSRMLHYRFQDHHPDTATGRDERWAIEFVKTPNLKKLEYIEVGYSSQTQRKNKIAKKWIICGTERELEVNGQPIRHKFRSWLHGFND